VVEGRLFVGAVQRAKDHSVARPRVDDEPRDLAGQHAARARETGRAGLQRGAQALPGGREHGRAREATCASLALLRQPSCTSTM